MLVGRARRGRSLPDTAIRHNAAVRVINHPRLRADHIQGQVSQTEGVSMIEGTWSEARRIESWPPPSLARAVESAATGEPSPSFAARRPIYDRALDVHAYELLFRPGDAEVVSAGTVVTSVRRHRLGRAGRGTRRLRQGHP
jgi:hypothetical protein